MRFSRVNSCAELASSDVGRSKQGFVTGALILVVEDDPALSEMLEMVLRRAGHRVITAADGWEALAHFPRKCGLIDLVVSDLRLPTIGAIEMYERIKDFGSPPKFLICSGLIESDTKVQFKAAGITEYIVKPFMIGELLDKVERLVAA